ncbi:MAG: HD-GYP domain-containing protein [Thermoleophilia bacterium]
MHIRDFLGGSSPQADLAVQMHERALAGESFSYEQPVGTLVFDIILGPLRDATSEIDGAIGVAYDMSDRKRDEESLRAHEADLAASAERLKKTLAAVIAALGATTELRDPYTAGHEQRVAEFAVAIARDLGWDEKQIETLRQAAPLHDVGKIIVSAEILTKPGKLSDLEMQLVRLHPQAGADAIANIGDGAPLAAMVVQHHERLDGSGYPTGLVGSAILPEALVLAVADVVEAMISHRPYRAALPLAEMMAELEDGASSRYDAEVCRVALQLLREQRFTFSG